MLVSFFLTIDQIESAMEGKWKSVAKFADFKATLERLSDDENQIQEEQSNSSCN